MWERSQQTGCIFFRCMLLARKTPLNGLGHLRFGLQAMLDDMLAAVLWAAVVSMLALLTWRLRSSI